MSESFRSRISEKFITLSEKYLKTGNPDSYYSGHNGQLIDFLRTLGEDNTFNTGMLYKEGYFTKAVLDESIDNWSTYLNYDKGSSMPSKATMTLLLSRGDDQPYRVVFPKNSQWKIGTIIYTLTTTINIINFGNNKLFIYKEDGDIEQLPFKYVYNSNTKTYDLLVRKIPLEQYQIVSNTLLFPNITTHEFKSFPIQIDDGNQMFGIDVTVNGEPFNPITNYQDFRLVEKSVLYSIKGDTLTITFGNGILGFLPYANSEIVIDAKLTLGSEGAVAAGDIEMVDPTLIIYGGDVRPIVYSHLPENSIPGSDSGSEIIKANAIADFRTNRRFVTNTDFLDFFQLLGLNTPVFVKRTRADMVKTNISAFLTIPDLNLTVAPTSTETVTLSLPAAQITNLVIPKGNQVTIDDDYTYKIPYELHVNTTSSLVSYRNRPTAPTATFKLISEYAHNNDTYSYFSMTDATAALDTTYSLLATDKMRYTIKLFQIYNDSSLQEGGWKIEYDTTINAGTIVESALEGYEFRYGYAALDTSGGGDFSSFLFGYQGSVYNEFLLDAAGTAQIAEFATDVDMGQTTRLVKFNQGYVPPSAAIDVIPSYITSNGTTANISFIKKTAIRYADYVKFDVIIDKNQESIGLSHKVLRKQSDSAPLPLIDYSVDIETLLPMDIELLSSSSVTTSSDIEITNVPLIEADYYDANIADIDNFLLQVGNVIQNAYKDMRMQNIDINIKFSKTYGLLKNIMFNQQNKIYTADPKWNPRVYFDIEVFLDPLQTKEPTKVVEEIKLAVLDNINDNKDYHKDIIVSKIQTIVQNITGVQYVKIISPIDNIVYSFDITKISKNDMKNFVPEYIYTTYDSINVTLLSSL
jgi:hypothetical protein